MKKLQLSLLAMLLSVAAFAVAPITGPSFICSGSTGTFTDATSGGVWSSSNVAVLTISSGGVGTGVSYGSAIITYDVSGSYATISVTVTPIPTGYSITGGGAYCAGGSGEHIGISGSSSGDSYQLFESGAAVGLPIPGTGSALDFGSLTSAGVYTVVSTSSTYGCSRTMTGSETISINPLPNAYVVTGGGTYCSGGAGLDISLVNSDAGVAYQLYLGSTPVGSVVAGTGSALDFGMQTAAGVYTVVATNSSTGCSSNMSGSATIAVSTGPTVGATATEASCGGSYSITASGATSYSWSPSTGLSCSTCSTTSCSGLTTSGTYVVTGTDTYGCTGTASVSVNFNRISGHITYSGGLSTDVFKVWLIQFNSSDSSITSLDSTNSCMDSGTPYYEFNSPASGSYMVKAKLNGTVAGSSGYIPTYSSSTPNWYDAASTAHTTSSDAMNITMVYGTVPAGPGFIGGYISAGAGRGTSGDVPAAGMLVYLKDASGHILTYTYTDGAGMYSFSSLGNASYVIYPENYSFYTTPSSVITLSTSGESVSGINFKQHNTFGTITPNAGTTSVASASAQGFNIYPNPATGNVSIQWSNKMTGNADVTITDVTGRTVLATTININAASGQSQLNVAELKNGIYLVSIKSATVSYNTKLVIQN